MRTASCFTLMLILLMAAVPVSESQQTKPRQSTTVSDTLSIDVDLVTIGVRVSDRSNREVSGLTQDDFSVFEDGQRQQIAAFAAGQQPASVLILLDRSTSMRQAGKLDVAKSALGVLVAERASGE